LTAFQPWWQQLGSRIGTPVKPVQVPGKMADDVHLRAVSIRTEIARRVTSIDMNVVFQRLQLNDEQRFDLIIGTNIFIYYGPFEQSLARANLAAMLKPGGFALSNDMLSEKVPSRLVEAHRTDIVVRSNPTIIEHVFCYRREP
jgi:chemotaxis methyl-accepting protein methylase